MCRQLSLRASEILSLICLSLIVPSLAGCGGVVGETPKAASASVVRTEATSTPVPMPFPAATPTSNTVMPADMSLNLGMGSSAYAPLIGNATLPGLSFVPVTPCRIADTRNPAGPFGGPFLQGNAAARAIAIPSSACSIPNTAQAYSLNITVVPHGPLGFVTAFPCGQPQ